MKRMIFSASVFAISINVLGVPVGLSTPNTGSVVRSCNEFVPCSIMRDTPSGIISDIEWSNSDNIVDSSEFFLSYIRDAGDLSSSEVQFNKGSLPPFSSSMLQNCDKSSLVNKFRNLISNKKEEFFNKTSKIIYDIKQKLMLIRELVSKISGKLRFGKDNVIEENAFDDIDDELLANALKNNFHFKPKENLDEFFRKSDNLRKGSVPENIYTNEFDNTRTDRIVRRDVRQSITIDDEPIAIKMKKNDSSIMRKLYDGYKKIRKFCKRLSWFCCTALNPKKRLNKLYYNLRNKLQKGQVTTVAAGFCWGLFRSFIKK